MFVLSLAGILVACLLMAYWREMREQERAKQRRQSLIQWYTKDDER